MQYVILGLGVAILIVLGMIMRRLDRIGAYLAEYMALAKAQAIQNMLGSLGAIVPRQFNPANFREILGGTTAPIGAVNSATYEAPDEGQASSVAGLHALLQRLNEIVR